MRVAKRMKVVSVLILGCLALSSCNEEAEVDAWAKKTSELRERALSEGGRTPYRKEQYEALKDYFAQIGGIALKIKTDDDFAKDFNKGLAKRDLAVVCDQALIAKTAWDPIIVNCTKNRFFLCAEEVRAYPQLVVAIRDRLSPELKSKFEQTESCTRSLK